MTIIRDPMTNDELAEAARAAVFLLALHSARVYGLVIGGPDVNVERCSYVLEEARFRGVRVPTVDEVLAP